MILEAAIFVLILNVLGFLWCYFKQSDHLTDLIYSLSFLSATCILFFSNHADYFHMILTAIIALWSMRLGLYLVIRVRAMGRDRRFDKLRKNWKRIGLFWLLQTISVWLILLPAAFAFQKDVPTLLPLHYIGFGFAILGFVFETIADHQKFVFRCNQNNKGLFIQHGLWKWVQYPNYSGEIIFWCGIFISISPHLQAFEWCSIISPIWISLLLLRISGIPILNRSAKQKYGHLESFKKYHRSTPKLIPYIY